MAFKIRLGIPEMEAFWTYGPARDDLTVFAIEPHPEDQKRGAYERIKLSSLPKPPEEFVKEQSKRQK